MSIRKVFKWLVLPTVLTGGFAGCIAVGYGVSEVLVSLIRGHLTAAGVGVLIMWAGAIAAISAARFLTRRQA